ncbi:hypothetical protein BO71DRAFT_119746 [Aspergillus ellipticus CBS 707.79]|uniref:Uncharacterized protein n=1 Tax=Aspergillus ellipticus CBS 707.79 TaxID=1448320 RepID=A0A319CUS3_9EURO|nr:hypothetical protein BO71DRAFT_119746 [Aspergillus ellipticus CBS 707.79]
MGPEIGFDVGWRKGFGWRWRRRRSLRRATSDLHVKKRRRKGRKEAPGGPPNCRPVSQSLTLLRSSVCYAPGCKPVAACFSAALLFSQLHNYSTTEVPQLKHTTAPETSVPTLGRNRRAHAGAPTSPGQTLVTASQPSHADSEPAVRSICRTGQEESQSHHPPVVDASESTANRRPSCESCPIIHTQSTPRACDAASYCAAPPPARPGPPHDRSARVYY